MTQQTLQALLIERVSLFSDSERPAAIIDEHVDKMFTEVIKDAFGRYNGLGEAVKEAVKAALPANISEVFELTKYNTLIANTLRDKWENSGVEADMVRRASEAIAEVLEGEQMPAIIQLSDLLQSFVDEHKEESTEERWERPDIRLQESEYGGLHIYFDKKPKEESSSSYGRSSERSEFSLENAIHISFDKNGADKNEQGRQVGRVYAARLDGENIGKSFTIRSKWQKMIAALYFGKAKIVVDCEEDEFSYDLYD